MKKFKILTKPTRVKDLSFEELQSGFSNNWELKAERLRARRWRKLKHQLA
jgi:hypothetical protein